MTLESRIDEEKEATKHLAIMIDSWMVELHGSLRGSLSSSIDRQLDDIHLALFDRSYLRTWMNLVEKVYMPRADEDLVYVFCHVLQLLFNGGIGLRQLCDLARVLWVFSSSINRTLLKQRLQKMVLMSEWIR